LQVATFDFKYRRFYDREDYLPAKHEMERIVDATHLTTGEGFSTVWAKIYGTWITDEIIDEEILRNICLALVGVMACTAVLIVNFQVCFWIFVCVLLTLINVGGFMYRWGLTLDIVSCIALQLSVGLCVDYAAHVGHTFLTVTHGTKTERAMECIVSIGAAVIYGGTSTVLSLSILVFSEAYTYRLFFKVSFSTLV
jgi:Niemann-Pick C1 protein